MAMFAGKTADRDGAGEADPSGGAQTGRVSIKSSCVPPRTPVNPADIDTDRKGDRDQGRCLKELHG